MNRYSATYTDVHGCEATSITNDGQTLRLSLRGVEFVGHDFDALEPTIAAPEPLRQFALNRGCLCSCRIECRIPVAVHERGKVLESLLDVTLVLGDPAAHGGLDRLQLRITLDHHGQPFASPGTSSTFENELLHIQAHLPADVYIKTCINCLYSDYSPYGNGLFGSMMCFRNLKGEYLTVKTKEDFWSVHGRQERFVQETYLCPEFERRKPGTGYRG